ncbi:MAG: class II aldolase/adducin family protein [Rhodospirillaceae bacterium]
MTEEEKREALIAACRKMNAIGINNGSLGNISIRHEDALLISPTSLPYEEMMPEDVVMLGMNGQAEGRHAPSSEWRFHRDIMVARPEIGAVVHCHPPYATALAILERDIPAVHYMVAVAGGENIRCAPYATYGTEELSAYALEALKGRTACLLAHHGMIAAEADLKTAMWLAEEVEALSRQYLLALQVTEPPCLTKNQIQDTLDKFAEGYGELG